MEPPVSLDANAIRDEKVKVLQAIRPLTEKDLKPMLYRGQYGTGFINGQAVICYRSKNKDVHPILQLKLLSPLRFLIDNWRWDGVPFICVAANDSQNGPPKLR